MKIPEDEQENVLHLFWIMLRECESQAVRGDKHDPCLKITVEGGYTVLNRIGLTKNQPHWIENK